MKKFVILLMLVLPVVIILLLNISVAIAGDKISVPIEKVELEKSTMVTNIGNVMTLDVNVYPTNASNKQLIWESSNNDIVQVDGSGNITFVGFGNAYVTVTTLDGSKKASCYFVVTDTIVHKIVLFTIDQVREVKIGQTLQFYAQIIPAEALNKEIVFTSSNSSIANIDQQGVVKGLSAGNTTIVATSVDGGHTASVDIEVYEPISAFSLPHHILTEQNFFQLDCNITPQSASITRINFSSSNEDVATVDRYGKVVFAKAGAVTIEAQYENLIQTVTIEFANGYATALNVDSLTKTIDYSEGVWQIEYSTIPSNLYQTEVEFVGSNPLVASVNATGLVQLNGGGVCVIGVRAEKYDGTILQKNITLFVSRDCETIEAQNIVSATQSFVLAFTALPEDNTQTEFFFEIDDTIATIENGIITFSQAGEVNVTIFADSAKTISKTITVRYTGGLPTSFDVNNSEQLNLGESFMILPVFTPQNTQTKNVVYSILSQNSPDGTTNGVVSVNNQGYVTALKGGSASIAVCVETTQGITIKTVQVNVISPATKIELLTELDYLNKSYITGNQTVMFNASVLPHSATNKALIFSTNDNNACQIVGSSVVFAYPATIVLTATNIFGGVSEQITITYTNQIQKVTFDTFPTSLMVGESANITAIGHIPSNIPASIVLQVTGWQTKSNGAVVTTSGNTISAQNGGEAQIAIYANGIFQTSFNITIVRLAESIDVYSKNITTTSETVLLNKTILPLDTSVTDVVWEIDQPTLAQINNDVLTFNGYGIVSITVYVLDSSGVSQTFWIERVSQQTNNIPPLSQSIQMFEGEFTQIQHNEHTQYEVRQTDEVVLFNDGLIHAKVAGTAEIICLIYNEFGVLVEVNEIAITVFAYVQDIALDFDYYGGEHVTAQERNALSYSVVPAENVLSEVTFSLMSTTLASIENDELVFYGVGTVWLVATSLDNNCTKTWLIRYTGGNAMNVTFNVGDIVTIEKNQSLSINVASYKPTNITNTSFQINLLTADAGNIINLSGNTIIGVGGGNVQIALRFSANITKTITVYVVEHLEQISFANKNLIIPESVYVLTPTLLPASATEKNLVYESSNETIARVQNGEVVFVKPGTVEISVKSSFNPLIKDSITITSTMGYPNNITLNTNNLTLITGESQLIYITSFMPQNIGTFNLELQVISSNPVVPQSQVVAINSSTVTALSSGTALVKASVINPYGMQIFALVEIVVIPEITNLEIVFDEPLNKVGDVFVTGQNVVDFQVFMLPANNATTEFDIVVSDNSIALVQGNQITFLKVGIVKITVISTFAPNVKTSVYINYTNNTALYVEINQSAFQNVGGVKQITLQKNSSFQFDVLGILPNNIEQLNVVLSQVATTPNAQSLPVAIVNQNTILLKNGGSVTYNLNINGFDLGNFKFVVTAMAQTIEVETTNAFISVPQFSINAIVLPLDTTNKALTFQSSNTATALVNEQGVVEFLKAGTVQILISNPASSVSKTITINYSKKVENITFNPTKTVMSVESVLLLNTQVHPSGIEGVTIAYTSSDQSIATVDAGGRVTAKNRSGVVTITARVVGGESIATSVNIQVIKYITNIALELDAVGDNLGIGGYRVFGNKFVLQNSYINTYQMQVLSVLPLDANPLLLWSSSNSSIATVSQSGLVTFVGTGKVTIRAEALNQYNPNMPVFDSYTFNVVSGVNVFNLEQFYKATIEQQVVVLQQDVGMTAEFVASHNISSITVYANIHGNGHTLALPHLRDPFDKLVLGSDNITIDNLVLVGEVLSPNTTLDDLSSSKVLLLAWKRVGIVITNTVFNGAKTLVRAVDSKIYFSGCVFINSGYTHILLVHKPNSTSQTIVTVENSIFKDALLSAIIFDFDTSSTDAYASKLILKGLVNIYNFKEKSKFRADTLIADYVPPVLQNLLNTNMAEMFSFFDGIKHTYNGKEYYHLGIIKLNLNYYLGKYQSYGTVDMTGLNTPNPYREYHASDIKLGVTLTFDAWTVMPGNITTISPDSTFDSTIYKTIRYIR